MAEKTDLPDWQDADSAEMQKQSTIMRDVTMGTLHIQSKGETYLDKYEAEEKEYYNVRVKNSELLPATAEAIESMTGKVLAKPTVLPEGDEFNAENIDNTGTTFQAFESEALRTSLRDGMDFILIDFPAVGERTRSEERASGTKPYYKIILADSVLNKRTSLVNGKIILTQVTIKEKETVDKGLFGTEEVDRYRVYRLQDNGVTVAVYEVDGDTIIPIEEEAYLNMNGLKEIPLVPLYTNKKGYLFAKPLLAEMAQINLQVYRLNSGLKRTIKNVGDPTHVGFGTPPMDEQGNPVPFVTGSNSMAWMEAGDDYKIVGVEPATVEVTRAEIETMKKDMAKIATEMASTERDKTAKEAGIDDSNQKSKLMQIAINLENTWNECYKFWNAFNGTTDENMFTVNRDFDSNALSPEEIKVLQDDHTAGRITTETYYKEMQKGERLTTIEDVEAEALSAANQLESDLGIDG